MQLTSFSDISLRLLIYLACVERVNGANATARGIATLFNVPYTHMVKVVHQLARNGWIVTTKGRGGGLRIAHPPDSLRIGKILRLTEPNGHVIDCFKQACPLRFECLLKHALDEAYESFFVSMDKYTIADMASMPELQALVQIAK